MQFRARILGIVGEIPARVGRTRGAQAEALVGAGLALGQGGVEAQGEGPYRVWGTTARFGS